ncbi:hypothetical protein CesoFtcFv8_025231 [Champsocephalus esox]|uniref:Uncharacterized protein n=1 Tax=Champsocephalus esox TaxID=159716 RepID=A0AAN8B4C4_9TELE|nr:hypothetical protein CesoFtcFv8_025231 [Champsocephalus esox]
MLPAHFLSSGTIENTRIHFSRSVRLEKESAERLAAARVFGGAHDDVWPAVGNRKRCSLSSASENLNGYHLMEID